MSRIVNTRPLYQPPPKIERAAEKPKRLISRQRRERMDRDAEYNAVRDIYLEENPYCALCDKQATQVHHICSGTAGRAASLRNSNTWLGTCSGKCHDKIESMSFEKQVALKVKDVKKTIARLRT